MFSIGASKRPNSISLEYNCFFPLLESYFKTVDSGTSVLLTSPVPSSRIGSNPHPISTHKVVPHGSYSVQSCTPSIINYRTL